MDRLGATTSSSTGAVAAFLFLPLGTDSAFISLAVFGSEAWVGAGASPRIWSDRDDDEDDNPDNQEDCEASGGTWYEERQYCQTD